MTDELVISGLEVSIGEKKILKGLDLTVRQGEVHALMGPNGSGKTSLAYTLMGHPEYRVDAGTVTWRGEDLLALTPDKRSRTGSSPSASSNARAATARLTVSSSSSPARAPATNRSGWSCCAGTRATWRRRSGSCGRPWT